MTTITQEDVWAIVGAAIAELPPYLSPDDVTAESTSKKYGISKVLAVKMLRQMVADGKLVEVDRLNPRGGSHIKAYERPKK